jgi:hypothetical protein
MAAQSISGGPPPRAVSSAMTAKVGVAARQSQSAVTRAADPRSFANGRFAPAGRDVMKIADTAVPQRLPIPRSSE